MVAANWTRSGCCTSLPVPPLAPITSSAADTSVTMNGSVTWPADVYIKPEIDIPAESAARQDVAVCSHNQSADSATSVVLGGTDLRKNVGERNVTTYDQKTNDIRSQSKTSTSPEVDRRDAVIERRLAAAAGAGYKYKDNIKRRFCSESDAQTPSHVDERSYSSLSDDGASSAPDNSSPSSPGVQPHSATPVSTDSYSRTAATADGQPQRSPGFVLHPSGAYYVPMIVSTAQLHALLSASAPSPALSGQQVICHPVSIPVRFTGSRGGQVIADVVSVNDTASIEHRLVHCQPLLQLQRL